MKPWTAFLPNVMPEVKACPRPLAVQAVRDAAIDFCEQTWLWQEIQDPYAIGPGDLATDFDAPRGAQVHIVLSATLVNGTKDVRPQTAEYANDHFPGWQTGTRTGVPEILVQIDSSAFFPVPIAANSEELVLHVAYKPTRDAVAGPDALLNDYYEAICMGAKARLMAMSEQPWANPQLALAYGLGFGQAKDRAQARTQKGFGRARRRVRGQYL